MSGIAQRTAYLGRAEIAYSLEGELPDTRATGTSYGRAVCRLSIVGELRLTSRCGGEGDTGARRGQVEEGVTEPFGLRDFMSILVRHRSGDGRTNLHDKVQNAVSSVLIKCAPMMDIPVLRVELLIYQLVRLQGRQLATRDRAFRLIMPSQERTHQLLVLSPPSKRQLTSAWTADGPGHSRPSSCPSSSPSLPSPSPPHRQPQLHPHPPRPTSVSSAPRREGRCQRRKGRRYRRC